MCVFFVSIIFYTKLLQHALVESWEQGVRQSFYLGAQTHMQIRDVLQ